MEGFLGLRDFECVILVRMGVGGACDAAASFREGFLSILLSMESDSWLSLCTFLQASFLKVLISLFLSQNFKEKSKDYT